MLFSIILDRKLKVLLKVFEQGFPWWLRLCAPNERGLGLIPGQGNGSHMATKTSDEPTCRAGIKMRRREQTCGHGDWGRRRQNQLGE